MSEIWSNLQTEVKKEIQDSGFLNAIFNEIEFMDLNTSMNPPMIQLGLVNSVSLSIAEKNLTPILRKHLEKVFSSSIDIKFAKLHSQNSKLSPQQLPLLLEELAAQEESLRLPDLQLKPQWFLNPSYQMNRFINGEHSNFAYKCVDFLTSTSAPEVKQLFLYGPSGVGKTHLLHALGWKFKEIPQYSKVKVFSAEEFMNDFHFYLSKKQMPEFRGKYRLQTDVLLIDDIHVLAKAKLAQEELFNIFNYYEQNNKFIAFTSDKSPHELEGFEPRLLTRFQGGLSAPIDLPDFVTRFKIAQEKQLEFGFSLSPETLHNLAQAVTSSVRSLEGALYKIGTYQKMMQKPITREELEKLLPALSLNQAPITEDLILTEVAKEFDLKIRDLKSTSRKALIVRARSQAMHRMREELALSYADIGRIFQRDHSSVISAIRKYSVQCSN